ncbi:putative mediator of RNA polymerase II transcription subunit 14 [Sitodiplosis mosellana]|uniref:putative mediator of RNA polymerase II transcription subunit 14 n=1 Tax=Sitodiplosis mosellana TaxID=263140 RepID=UPI002443E734|nr:putative mediator of RNA polymerase II transcription subunit 14 [Sitodiplosis mosellana]
MSYDANVYKILKDKFNEEWRKIEPYRRRALTRDDKLRQSYKTNIIVLYNAATCYLKTAERSAKNEKDRKAYRSEQANALSKLTEAFKLLKLTYNFSQSLFAEIAIEDVIENSVPVDTIQHNSNTVSDSGEGKSDDLFEDSEKVESSVNTASTTGTADTAVVEDQLQRPLGAAGVGLVTDNFNETENTMVLEKAAYLSLMAAHIRKNYNGDPNALQPFLATIDLLKDLAEDSRELLTSLKKFVLAKLEGIACEIVPTNPNSIDDIVDALKSKIKCESSDVIEGRMMTLRADRSNLHEFSTKVEELADAFRRALVKESIPLEKAEEMTVKKTVQLCRANTNNVTVKSVLTSCKFDNPKEVVAKFIVESNTTRQEAQVLAFRSQNRRGRRDGNWRGDHRNGNRNDNGRDRNQNNRNRDSYNRNQNRGRYQNDNNANRNNNNQNNGDRRQNNNNNNRGRNVRHVENATASQRTMGEADD